MMENKQLNWKFKSPETPGFHVVVSPENSDCKTTWGFRLNLREGEDYQLTDENIELNGVLISGHALVHFGEQELHLTERDSFYLPAKQTTTIKAASNLVIFLGGAPCESKGQFFVSKYDLTLPLGNIHQIHGKPPYQREVFMTISQ